MRVFTRCAVWAAACVTAVMLPSLSEIAAQQAATPAAQAARRQVTVGSQGPLPEHAKFETEQIEAGGGLFLSNCAFCHGKDAGGGESGPDLTRSKLVEGDKKGEAIGNVVRNGRQEKGMPRFSLSDTEIMNLVAFIHSQQDKAMSQSGNRKGVDESDLKTGDAEAGKRYFEGTGRCSTCHSPSGDLAHIATKFTGLALLEQMLYPKNVKTKVTVKTATGQSYDGILEYQDEFHIGMKDSFGTYHSWPVTAVTFKVDNAVDQHVEIMSRYTDKDMHDVLAYLQTMK
jgi:cytochrome c oxidase cbb3-type subunit III